MKDFNAPTVALRHPKSKGLLKFIDKNFSTLAFCRRWLDRGGQTSHLIALKELVNTGIVHDLYPLVENTGAYVAQYEHTLILKPTGKEVLSIGDDY